MTNKHESKKDDLVEANEQLKEELRLQEERSKEAAEQLQGVLTNRQELAAANDSLMREIDLLRQRMEKLPEATVYEAILELIAGAEMQRLFHNPTTPAMRQAAGLITAKILSL